MGEEVEGWVEEGRVGWINLSFFLMVIQIFLELLGWHVGVLSQVGRTRKPPERQRKHLPLCSRTVRCGAPDGGPSL